MPKFLRLKHIFLSPLFIPTLHKLTVPFSIHRKVCIKVLLLSDLFQATHTWNGAKHVSLCLIALFNYFIFNLIIFLINNIYFLLIIEIPDKCSTNYVIVIVYTEFVTPKIINVSHVPITIAVFNIIDKMSFCTN